MLASVVAATVRVEGKLDKMLAELASLPRPAGHSAPRHPVALRPRTGRWPCRERQPRLRGVRQCAHDRRGH
jgi:hypothetical protein